MLESLYIRNLVLVKELQLDFHPGFNTVSGETGAGKSLILGALQLIGGGRASAGFIRQGAEQCEAAAVIRLPQHFPALRNAINALMEECGVPSGDEEGLLLLRRVITPSGSRAFINGSNVTAGVLKAFGELLIDIHGPNDSQSLLQPSRQLHLLDLYGGHKGQLAQVQESWKELMELRRRLAAIKDSALAPEEKALLQHQLNEITQAEVNVEEEAELIRRHKSAANAVAIQSIATGCADALALGDNTLVDQLAQILRRIGELPRLDPEGGEPFLQRLEGVSRDLCDIAGDLQDYSSQLEMDEQSFRKMEERLGRLQSLKRRYGPTLQDVLDTASRIQEKLRRANSMVEEVRALQESMRQCQERFSQQCAQLGEMRRAAAARLAPAVSEKLRKLGFAQAFFQVEVSPAAASASGTESCEFRFAPNPGEAPSTLREAASSGEVARVMLAIKTVLSNVDDMPVLVFDEIDANVGGVTALAVARELRSVAKHHQVFSITHLPLIAAAGNEHFVVSKQIADGRTTSDMHRMDDQERLAEIVRMMGAQIDDAAAVAHARQMLDDAREEP